MMGVCLALCFSSLSALCLGTERHYQQVFAGKTTARRHLILRLLGWLLLLTATVPAVIALGVSVGLAQWTALLGLAASVLVVLLTYTPRLITPMALGAPLLSLSLLLL